MCGIAGFEARDDRDQTIAASLTKALASRGPDGAWIKSTPSMNLVQTRLAVIDLSDDVRYPMPNEDESLWLLFNGEIYNHADLRSELEAHGHRFRTRCDAEVVLHGWEQWGAESLARLQGMFAIGLLDERSGETILARDRLGIKPLVHTVDGRFAFASDAMALVGSGLSSGQVDYGAIAEFALLHYTPDPLTGIRDLRQIEPGTFTIRGRGGDLTTSRFTPEPFASPGSGSPADEAAIEAALVESVRRELAADVEVGVLLSSGIDSSLLASCAIELGSRPTAFTVGFGGHGGYDERPGAERLAASLGLPHAYEDLSVSFEGALGGVAGAYDMPFADSSAIATRELARLARGSATVVLSGTGGDDLFGGYYRHRAHLFLGLLSRIPGPVLRRLRRIPSGRGHERDSRSALLRFYLGRLTRASDLDPWHQYLAVLTDLSSPTGLAALRIDQPWEEVGERVASRHGLGGSSAGSILRELQRFELRTYVPGDLLVKEDRATMAVGLEARVPMLNQLLIDAAERTPDGRKVSVRAGKLALRAIARRRLPREIARGRKRGFAVPLAGLMRGRWRAELGQWARESESELVDLDAVPALVGADGGPADAWAWVSLAAWERRLASQRRAGAEIAAAGAR